MEGKKRGGKKKKEVYGFNSQAEEVAARIASRNSQEKKRGKNNGLHYGHGSRGSTLYLGEVGT